MHPQTFKVALPPDVRHFDFLLQPEAHRPSILLMLMLRDQALTSGARSSVHAGFLPDGADFAVAIGRDFIVKTLKENMFQGLPGSFHHSKFGVSATVRPDFAGATFDLAPGRIEFRLHGDGDISWWGVDDHFTFDVRQAFSLQLVDGALQPVAVGEPVVDLHGVAVGGGFIEGRARTTIREERDKALVAGGSVLADQFDIAKRLRSIMAGINPKPAGVTLTGVEIRADGVVLPGRMSLAAFGPGRRGPGRSGTHERCAGELDPRRDDRSLRVGAVLPERGAGRGAPVRHSNHRRQVPRRVLPEGGGQPRDGRGRPAPVSGTAC